MIPIWLTEDEAEKLVDLAYDNRGVYDGVLRKIISAKNTQGIK